MFKASTRMEGFSKLRYQLSLPLNFFGGDTYVRKNVASPKMKKKAQNITIVSDSFHIAYGGMKLRYISQVIPQLIYDNSVCAMNHFFLFFSEQDN